MRHARSSAQSPYNPTMNTVAPALSHSLLAAANAIAGVESGQSLTEALAAETAKRMSEFVARRTAQAEAKIVIAESQAMNDVRSAAADAAVKVAETILRAQMQDGASADMLTRGIGDVRKGFAH